jgi:hypothetical protein
MSPNQSNHRNRNGKRGRGQEACAHFLRQWLRQRARRNESDADASTHVLDDFGKPRHEDGMSQVDTRRGSGALDQHTRLAVSRWRDQWDVAKLSESHRRTRVRQGMALRNDHVQRLSTEVNSLDSACHDFARDDAEIGKATDDIVDDGRAVSSPNLHVDERPLLTEYAYQARKRVMDLNRQSRDNHLPSLLRRNLPESTKRNSEIVEHSFAHRHEVPAGGRELESAGASHKQTHTNKLLDSGDRTTQRGLRSLQERRCANEAPIMRDRDEGLKFSRVQAWYAEGLHCHWLTSRAPILSSTGEAVQLGMAGR